MLDDRCRLQNASSLASRAFAKHVDEHDSETDDALKDNAQIRSGLRDFFR